MQSPLLGSHLKFTHSVTHNGLAGVFCIPDIPANDGDVKEHLMSTEDAVSQLARAAELVSARGTKLHIALLGPATNVAMFLTLHPKLAKSAIQEIVWMGGTMGVGE